MKRFHMRRGARKGGSYKDMYTGVETKFMELPVLPKKDMSKLYRLVHYLLSLNRYKNYEKKIRSGKRTYVAIK